MDTSTTIKRKATKVVVRRLERLETTAAIIDPGCRGEGCG